jgi:hypothetical protein
MCRFEFPRPELPEVVGVGLRALAGVASRAEKLERWLAICRQCQARGYKPGWAAHRFRDSFGHYPPRDFPRVDEVA